MSDWTEALRVASESTAIDLVTAGVLDEIRHAFVVGRLVDRETITEAAVRRFTFAGYRNEGGIRILLDQAFAAVLGDAE